KLHQQSLHRGPGFASGPSILRSKEGSLKRNTNVRIRSRAFRKGFSAMNFRLLTTSALHRGRAFALFAAVTLVAVPFASDAPAQQAPPPKGKAAPAKGAQQAPAANQAAPADQQVQLIY